MGGFSNFAVSFSIISILTGAVLLYGYGLKYGGPLINTLGWPLVSAFVLCVAASMAEIASKYPTAGGLYYWSFRMGGPGIAWLCAWLNLIGQITITAGINIGAATYLTGLVTETLGIPADAAVPLLGPINGWNFWLAVMFVLMVPQVILNIRGIRLVARLSEFSVIWHIVGVAMIAILLTFLGRYHNGWAFLVSTTHPANPGDGVMTFAIGPLMVPSLMMRIPGMKQLYGSGAYAFAFVLGLLQAQWTYTGYDASAHLAEETYLARMNSAWGVFLSVAVSAIAGYVALIVLTDAIPPGKIAETAADPYPVLYIVRPCTGSLLRQRDRRHYRGCDVAVRAHVDHFDGADVLRVCARSRDTRMEAGEPNRSALEHAGDGDPDYQLARVSRDGLFSRIQRDHLDEHHVAVSCVFDSDLSQLAQPASRAGRVH